MKYKKIKVNLIINAFLFIVLILFPSVIYATDEVIINENVNEKIEVYSFDNWLLNKKLSLTSTFDLRNVISIPVRDQKTTQQCWAFASNYMIETFLKLQSEPETFDFSERHLVYATTYKFLNEEVNTMGFDKELKVGGNSALALAYYTNGQGPVLESDMPFNINEGLIELSEIENKEVQKKVTDYIKFPSILKEKTESGIKYYSDYSNKTELTLQEVTTIRNQIKNHIMTYGAIEVATINGNNEYYNYNTLSYYCDDIEYAISNDNHAIVIIGWDDNYAVENFNSEHRPSSPGAYLVMTTTGLGIFTDGCYYISYEDAIIETNLYGITGVSDIDYDNIYQYDPLGIDASISGGNQQIVWGANVFSKDKNTVEKLTEISVASEVEEACEVYVNALNGDVSTNSLVKVEVDKSVIKNGYTTLKLTEEVLLTGEKFVVAVKYISTNSEKAYIGIEATKQDLTYWNTATSGYGESYIKTNTVWQDLKNTRIENANICIKAFTIKTGDNISSTNYNVEKDYIVNISPNTTALNFKNKITAISEYELKFNDIVLEDNEIIKTGTILKTNSNVSFVLIVLGDLTGTGNINATDISKIRQYILEAETLSVIEKKAADINGNGTVTLTDFSKMKAAFVGKINL